MRVTDICLVKAILGTNRKCESKVWTRNSWLFFPHNWIYLQYVLFLTTVTNTPFTLNSLHVHPHVSILAYYRLLSSHQKDILILCQNHIVLLHTLQWFPVSFRVKGWNLTIAYKCWMFFSLLSSTIAFISTLPHAHSVLATLAFWLLLRHAIGPLHQLFCLSRKILPQSTKMVYSFTCFRSYLKLYLFSMRFFLTTQLKIGATNTLGVSHILLHYSANEF